MFFHWRRKKRFTLIIVSFSVLLINRNLDSIRDVVQRSNVTQENAFPRATETLQHFGKKLGAFLPAINQSLSDAYAYLPDMTRMRRKMAAYVPQGLVHMDAYHQDVIPLEKIGKKHDTVGWRMPAIFKDIVYNKPKKDEEEEADEESERDETLLVIPNSVNKTAATETDVNVVPEVKEVVVPEAKEIIFVPQVLKRNVTSVKLPPKKHEEPEEDLNPVVQTIAPAATQKAIHKSNVVDGANTTPASPLAKLKGSGKKIKLQFQHNLLHKNEPEPGNRAATSVAVTNAKLALIYTYENSFPNSLATLFNQNADAFYVHEPLDAFLSLSHGVRHWSNRWTYNTARDFTKDEIQRQTVYLNKLLSCQLDDVTELITFGNNAAQSEKLKAAWADFKTLDIGRSDSCTEHVHKTCSSPNYKDFCAQVIKRSEKGKGKMDVLVNYPAVFGNEVPGKVALDKQASRVFKSLQRVFPQIGKSAGNFLAKKNFQGASDDHKHYIIMKVLRLRSMLLAEFSKMLAQNENSGAKKKSVSAAFSSFMRQLTDALGIRRSQTEVEGLVRNATFSNVCRNVYSMLSKPYAPAVKHACMTSRVRALKLTRTSFDALADLLKQRPNAVIIHVLRDPRAAILSEIKKQSRGDTLKLATALCRKIYNDTLALNVMLQTLPMEFLQMKYEQIVMEPAKAIKSMENALGGELLKDAKDAMKAEAARESQLVEEFEKTSPILFQQVEKQCEDVLKLYGYIAL